MRIFSAIFAMLISVSGLSQGPENVLVVVNKSSKVSKAIGDYYRTRRGVPNENVCLIKTFPSETIARDYYEKDIRDPIVKCLATHGIQDRILYILLTKGVPLKIKESAGGANDFASVDSELTLAYADLARLPHRLRGSLPNPYFNANDRGRFLRFSHKRFPIYLVTRLDGYDLADVCALIDRAMQPASTGQFVLDLTYNDNLTGNNWLRAAAEELKKTGVPESRIRLETSETFLTEQQDVMGYASWGSNDRSDHSRFLNNRWVNGALDAEYVSTNARTFDQPPKNWTIGKWSDPGETFFAGAPQSLLADAIHEGVTGAAGYVYEPFLSGCVRPQILFPAYVQGLNLAESFYLAMPYLSWQNIVVGDPLTAPYPGTPLAAEEADPPKDPASGLAIYFARFAATRR
jgi:uncharacterized protein (TIGR03790 family)